MFAPTFADAVRIASEPMQDPIIGQQGIVVREFVPLRVLEVGINEQPFADEWRIFYLGNSRLAHGFYWSQAEARGEMYAVGLAFADKVAAVVSRKVNFFVLDIARTAAGEWTLIEVNDGQMSGLSEVDPEELYSNLAKELMTFRPTY